MPLGTTTGQDNALAAPVARVVYFVEFHFKSSVLYVSTMNQNYTWGGNTWIGVGSLGSIDTVEESEQVISQPLNFTLNISQPSIFALAAGDPAEFRGGEAKMYMCPLTEQFQLIDTPILCWRGYMDMVSIMIDNTGAGTITLKCETSAYGLRKLPSLRMTAAQQILKHPSDTGFNLLSDLIARPQTWFSAAAQKIIFTP
jgi:hypothetical protein